MVMMQTLTWGMRKRSGCEDSLEPPKPIDAMMMSELVEDRVTRAIRRFLVVLGWSLNFIVVTCRCCYVEKEKGDNGLPGMCEWVWVWKVEEKEKGIRVLIKERRCE